MILCPKNGSHIFSPNGLDITPALNLFFSQVISLQKRDTVSLQKSKKLEQNLGKVEAQLFKANKRWEKLRRRKRKEGRFFLFQRCDELEQQGLRVRSDTQTRVRSLLKVNYWFFYVFLGSFCLFFCPFWYFWYLLVFIGVHFWPSDEGGDSSSWIVKENLPPSWNCLKMQIFACTAAAVLD